MKNLLLCALLTVCCSGVLASSVQEFPADKVLVIIKDDGSVIIREPRLEDYVHAQEMRDKQRKEISVKDRIFGKKCPGH